MQPRRLTQATPAITLLLVAFGLANLRPPARGFLLAVIIVYGVTTVDFYRHKPPWEAVSIQGTQYAQQGDVVLTDVSGGDYQLQYYYGQMLPDGIIYRSLKEWRDFFPETYEAGLPALLDSTDTVWLMHWSQDTSVFAWLDKLNFQDTARFITEHDAGTHIEALTTYRFDRPYDDLIVRFENGMVLRDAKVDEANLHVDLLWSNDEALEANYTTSVIALNTAGQVVAQRDSFPQLNTRPTSGWPDDDWVFDPKWLEESEGVELTAGDYELFVQVYLWSNDGIQQILTTDGKDRFPIGKLSIHSP